MLPVLEYERSVALKIAGIGPVIAEALDDVGTHRIGWRKSRQIDEVSRRPGQLHDQRSIICSFDSDLFPVFQAPGVEVFSIDNVVEKVAVAGCCLGIEQAAPGKLEIRSHELLAV